MKTLLEMSLEHYHGLLAKCAASDREYGVMKNGVVIDNRARRAPRTVAILCESGQAKKIIDLVSQLYPEAAPHVQEFTESESQE